MATRTKFIPYTDDEALPKRWYPLLHLTALIGGDRSSGWKNGLAGKFGPIYLDARGRQLVDLAHVERVTRRAFTWQDIERAAITIQKDKDEYNATRKARRHAVQRSIEYGLYTPEQVECLVREYVTKRDAQWIECFPNSRKTPPKPAPVQFPR